MFEPSHHGHLKVLIVAQYFPPDITAAAFRMYDTACLLEDRGHEVQVITAYPHRSLVKDSSLVDYDSRISRVWRTRVSPLNGGRFWDYIRHYSSFMVGSSWLGSRRRLSRWKPDVIWASSPPLFVGLSGAVLSRLFGVPLVLDVRDIWPASAVGTGQLSQGGRAYRIGTRMEQYVYDKAAHITCVARPMQEYIRSRTKTPVSIVYNGTMACDIVESGSNLCSQDEHVLLYAGNLGRAQQLDLLIRAWASVSGQNGASRWMVRLLGSGASEGYLRELAVDLGVADRVKFCSPVSRPESIQQMRDAAVLCVSLQANGAFERTIPSKVFDCMAQGKPVLAGIAGEGRRLLESTGANLCYDPGDQQGLERALHRLMREYVGLRALAYDNAKLIRREYTRERAVEALERVLGSVACPQTTVAPSRGFQIDLGPCQDSHAAAPPDRSSHQSAISPSAGNRESTTTRS